MAKEGKTSGFGLDGATKTSSFCKPSRSIAFALPGEIRDLLLGIGKTGRSGASGVGECADRLRGLSMIAERCFMRLS